MTIAKIEFSANHKIVNYLKEIFDLGGLEYFLAAIRANHHITSICLFNIKRDENHNDLYKLFVREIACISHLEKIEYIDFSLLDKPLVLALLHNSSLKHISAHNNNYGEIGLLKKCFSADDKYNTSFTRVTTIPEQIDWYVIFCEYSLSIYDWMALARIYELKDPYNNEDKKLTPGVILEHARQLADMELIPGIANCLNPEFDYKRTIDELDELPNVQRFLSWHILNCNQSHLKDLPDTTVSNILNDLKNLDVNYKLATLYRRDSIQALVSYNSNIVSTQIFCSKFYESKTRNDYQRLIAVISSLEISEVKIISKYFEKINELELYQNFVNSIKQNKNIKTISIIYLHGYKKQSAIMNFLQTISPDIEIILDGTDRIRRAQIMYALHLPNCSDLCRSGTPEKNFDSLVTPFYGGTENYSSWHRAKGLNNPPIDLVLSNWEYKLTLEEWLIIVKFHDILDPRRENGESFTLHSFVEYYTQLLISKINEENTLRQNGSRPHPIDLDNVLNFMMLNILQKNKQMFQGNISVSDAIKIVTARLPKTPRVYDTRKVIDSQSLHFAVKYDSIYIIKFMLDYGAKLNELDETGNTALQNAIAAGKLDVVKILLIYGAKTDGINTDDILHTEIKKLLESLSSVDKINSSLIQGKESINFEQVKIALGQGAVIDKALLETDEICDIKDFLLRISTLEKIFENITKQKEEKTNISCNVLAKAYIRQVNRSQPRLLKQQEVFAELIAAVTSEAKKEESTKASIAKVIREASIRFAAILARDEEITMNPAMKLLQEPVSEAELTAAAKISEERLLKGASLER